MGNSDDKHISSLTSIGQGAFYYISGRFTSQVLGLVAVTILTNALGSTQYGIYAFATTIITLLASIANLGTDKANLRFLPDPEKSKSIFWSFSTILAGIGATAAAILVLVAAPVVTRLTIGDSLLTTTLQVFGALLVVKIGTQLSSSAFRAVDRPDLNMAVHQITMPVLKVATFGVLFLVGGSYLTYLLGITAVTAVVSVLGILVLFTQTAVRPRVPTGVSKTEFLDFSIPAAIKDVGSIMYNRIDILMLGFFATASGIGVYNVAVVLGSAISLPLTGVNNIFPSIASNLYASGNRDDLERVYQSVTRWVVTASLPIALVIIVYRHEVLSLLGPDFLQGADILVVLLTGHFMNTVVGPSGYLLLMTDRQRLVMVNQWAFGVLNVALNYLLIMRIGVMGAAIATTITLAGLNVARLAEVYYFEGWFPYSVQLMKPLLASVGMVVIMIAAKMLTLGIVSMGVGGITGAVTFLVLLYLMGITAKDRQVLQEFRKSL
jgi:O-antigen/teichoic acid export membrane protein